VVVVSNSRDPECDLARALLARGITGGITLVDGVTGKPRILIRDVQRLAGLVVKEGAHGPRFAKWKETCPDRASTAETALAGMGGAL
jgi:hypothetical protein